MNELYLHCGAAHIERDALANLPIPQSRGNRHQPIHHFEFVEEMERALDEQGYELTESAYGVTHNGNRFFGVATVEHPALRAFDGGSFTVGFRGAHDMSFTRSLAAGGRIFVCDSLAFNGNVVLHTRQTTHISDRIVVMLDDMVGKLFDLYSRQLKQYDAYRLQHVSDTVANSAILEMGRQDVVNFSELGKVVAEWDNPTHEEHAEDGNSVWRLFNAATETMKLRNAAHPRLPQLPEKTMKLHRICDELAELPFAA